MHTTTDETFRDLLSACSRLTDHERDTFASSLARVAQAAEDDGRNRDAAFYRRWGSLILGAGLLTEIANRTRVERRATAFVLAGQRDGEESLRVRDVWGLMAALVADVDDEEKRTLEALAESMSTVGEGHS